MIMLCDVAIKHFIFFDRASIHFLFVKGLAITIIKHLYDLLVMCV